jgi:hypothetical protein
MARKHLEGRYSLNLSYLHWNPESSISTAFALFVSHGGAIFQIYTTLSKL